jgi:hypothetical protein
MYSLWKSGGQGVRKIKVVMIPFAFGIILFHNKRRPDQTWSNGVGNQCSLHHYTSDNDAKPHRTTSGFSKALNPIPIRFIPDFNNKTKKIKVKNNRPESRYMY